MGSHVVHISQEERARKLVVSRAGETHAMRPLTAASTVRGGTPSASRRSRRPPGAHAPYRSKFGAPHGGLTLTRRVRRVGGT